jgi:maleylacetoacetate isomerase
MMRFFGYFRSSAAYRCRIALSLKDIDYEFVSVHLRRGGGEQHLDYYRQLNPQGLVPVLEHGDFRLSQSLAIIEWLDETQPEPALLPKDANARATVRAFAQILACDTHPLQNLRVLQYLRAELQQGDEQVTAWCRHWVEEGLAACEALLARQSHGDRYCFGATPGLADICLIPQVFSAERFGVDLSAMPNIRRVALACEELDAFTAAHPSRQPDSE